MSYWLKLFLPAGAKRRPFEQMKGTRIGNLMLAARVGNMLGFSIKSLGRHEFFS